MAAHAVAAAAALGLVATLQGCGSGGETTTTAPTTTTTTTSTTTTTTEPQVPPQSGSDAAKYLNEQYMSLNESNTSSIGVVIHMAHQFEFFCHEIPALNTSCYEGRSDCMCSTSVYNHKMSLSDKNSFAAFSDMKAGMVFNTSMVHSKLAKCAYQFDGGSDRRYNHGCGTLPDNHTTCDDPLNSYYNVDPGTGEEVTDESELVTQKYCRNKKPMPTNPKEDQCYWKGAGFYPPHEHPDELRQMIDQRLRNEKGKQGLVELWNEIVLDVKLIHEELMVQPALVIPAMVWVKRDNDEEWNKISKSMAEEMAESFARDYRMNQKVPIVAVQDWLDVTKKGFSGPFIFDGSEDTIV